MIAFIPALALHRAAARPVMNPKLSFALLFATSFVICSCRISTAPLGEIPEGEGKMRVDRRGVGDQSVERYKRGKCGKDRQQRIEDDAGGDGKQSVIVDARIYAPKDILPACPRDFPRSCRAPSAPRLLRPVELGLDRLIVLELLARPFVGFRWRWRRIEMDLNTPVKRRVRRLAKSRAASSAALRWPARPLGLLPGALLPRSPQERHRPTAAISFAVPPIPPPGRPDFLRIPMNLFWPA